MLLTYRAEIFVHIEQSKPVKAETENFVHKSLFEIAFVQVLGGWAVLEECLPRRRGSGVALDVIVFIYSVGN